MSRYIVTVDETGQQLNDGPALSDPVGGVVVYLSMEEATSAAQRLVKGGHVKGAYVQLLRPVAFYLPNMSAPVEVEGAIEPPKESN